MGRCDARTGIASLGRLGKPVLAEAPSRAGERLFELVDNGSSPRRAAPQKRLHQVDARLLLVHTPVHASWLHQGESDFAILQRQVLPPPNFADLAAIRLRLALDEERSPQHSTPVQWQLDRTTLTARLAKIEA